MGSFDKNMKDIIFKKASLMVLYHMMAFAGLLYVLFNGSWYHFLTLAFLHYVHVSWCSSATFHRFLAHKSWNAPRWFVKFCTLFAVTGCYGSSIAWTSIHRAHHKWADTEKDPHSPVTKPWWYVVFGVFYYDVSMKLVTDLLRDKFHVFVHQNYFKIMFGYVAFCFLVFDPVWAATLSLAQGSLAYITAGAMLNILCHKFGYRNYEVGDQSTNNLFLGFILHGEGWHNNHHGQPGALFGHRHWWEVDTTWRLIKLLDPQAKETM
jgi:stearoyl-CoA desaturase (delta-9 desaturase)